MLPKYGIFSGRWQPFHVGHLWVVRRILDFYQFVILGIVNPDPENPSDPNFHKFKIEMNPFTYWERSEMLSTLFRELELEDRIFFVPMWHPRVSLDKENAFLPPKNAREWIVPLAEIEEYKKAEDFDKLGETVITIENIPEEILSCHSILLRNLMAENNGKWRHFVPASITRKIIEYNGIERVRRMYNIDKYKNKFRAIDQR